METINVRAGFLSNKETLSILTAQRDARAAQIRTLQAAKASRVAKLGRRAFAKEGEDEEADRLQPQDLHTVTFECIKYLEESVHPLRRQTNDSISTLLDELEKLDLTKAERLQIVNLAPTTLVALTVCVEDFEDRFRSPEDQAHILALVSHHLSDPSAPTTISSRGKPADAMDVEEEFDEEEEDGGGQDGSDDEFVHEGLQGAGEPPDRELDEDQGA